MIIRCAQSQDAAAMADILNAVIAIGGTTAHQTAKSVETVLANYITGPDVLSSVVAEDQGQVIGWQSAEHWQGDAHIGTFVRPGIQAKGVGAAMFALSRDILHEAGITSIIASIRKDNVPGLAYYARMGFVDFAEDPGFALDDGTVVGRVHRRFDLV
ncbi:MAG: GNAT family N-acetyltransferase [Paracoccaceae bacterium]